MYKQHNYKKQYSYNSTINIDLVIEHFHNFIQDLNLENNNNNIKYITLFIELEYTDHRGYPKILLYVNGDQ